MKFKRAFLILGAVLLSSCRTPLDNRLSLLVPSGAPFLSVAGIAEETKTEVTVGPDLLPVAFTKGEKDFIIAPITIGAKLYNLKQSNYQLQAVLGWSNLYLLSRTPITDVQDLEGEEVLAFAEHATPGIMLSFATKDIDLNLTYFKTVSDVVGPFLARQYDTVLMSEPLLSKVIAESNEPLHIFDLQSIDTLPQIAQFGLFVSPEADQPKVADYLSKLATNISELNTSAPTYVDRIIDLDVQFTNLGKEVLVASIPRLDLAYVSGSAAKTVVNDFFSYLVAADPLIIGDHVVDGAFYV